MFFCGNQGYHATGGFLTVSKPKFVTPIGEEFLKTAHYFGYHVVDVNGHTQTGVLAI